MSDKAEIIQLPVGAPRGSYAAARARLTEFLIRYTLIDSFFNFTRDGKPYPFADVSQILPASSSRSTERPHQNTAFVILLDGTLPRGLNKHFRLRASNRVTWRNIQRLAPELDISDFKSTQTHLDSPDVARLLEKLLTLDYALVAERIVEDDIGEVFKLTHMHVKVERLTDNAIKDLARDLGYIERRLFARGEDYGEALESKFFEYYGFPPNAAGRRSAAAMSAQLIAKNGFPFTVFASSQEDCRLTVLDNGDVIEQYMLVRLTADHRAALAAAASQIGITELAPYLIGSDEAPVAIYRASLNRTAATRSRFPANRDENLLAPWLEIGDEVILANPNADLPPVPFTWAALAAAEKT